MDLSSHLNELLTIDAITAGCWLTMASAALPARTVSALLPQTGVKSATKRNGCRRSAFGYRRKASSAKAHLVLSCSCRKAKVFASPPESRGLPRDSLRCALFLESQNQSNIFERMEDRAADESLPTATICATNVRAESQDRI